MKLIDLQAQYRALQPQIQPRIQAVLDHGQFIGGPEIHELESALEEFCGTRYCITCASGTDALQVLYMAYGIGRGNAVFCPDVTFIASVEPAYMLGATPVFCDIDPNTYNLCPQSLERQIKAVLKEGKLVPKAVVAVDFLGNPADYESLTAISEKYDLLLIEDAAQSMGARYREKACCSFGHAAATSFFPAKPLGCYGDGGAIFLNDEEIASVLRSLCVHGKGPRGKYDNVRIGINSRLDTIQAAVLLVKLAALQETELKARQQVAQRYDAAFSGTFVTPFVAPESQSVYAQYALLAHSQQQRDEVLHRLDARGIPNMVYYPTPQHRLPVFAGLPCYGERFEQAERYCAQTFSIPMHPYLTPEEQTNIINTVLGK